MAELTPYCATCSHGFRRGYPYAKCRGCEQFVHCVELCMYVAFIETDNAGSDLYIFCGRCIDGGALNDA